MIYVPEIKEKEMFLGKYYATVVLTRSSLGTSTAALRCQLELMTPVPYFQCCRKLVGIPVSFVFS